MTIHALWCHPRSVSTAFERVMRERGDLDVLHEPFLYEFYLNQSTGLFPDFEPDADHPRTYDDIRRMILARSEVQTLFIKEMAFYALIHLRQDPAFLARMTHCFLIRDPVESILSYYHRDPDFSLFEVGIEAQHQLYQTLRTAGISPLVITSDDLRADPQATLRRYWSHVGLADAPHAFEWDNKVPKGWEAVKGWHRDTLNSGAIKKAASTRDYRAELAALGAPFTTYDSHHRPFYDALKEIADRQSGKPAEDPH